MKIATKLPLPKSSSRNRIFQVILENDGISQQLIAEKLNLSIPTIRQSLKELYAEGIIREVGYYESTGGRKAAKISIDASAKIAIGVELLKESIQIVAINLKGTAIREQFISMPFSNTEEYYSFFGSSVNNFIDGFQLPGSNFLGIYISVQGLVSREGDVVVSGDILGYTGTTKDVFEKYLKYPCRLLHDTEAAAFAELWNQPDIVNAIYIVLNRYLGGALIINRKVYQGEELSSGCIIEHMRLVPNGKKCYCGQNGCLEAYCSVSSIEREAGTDIESFFKLLAEGDPHIAAIFNDFLEHLALAINNIRMVIDCDFIIGGLLEEYLSEEHLSYIAKRVNEIAAFNYSPFSYRHSYHGRKAASRGAALILLNEYLNRI